MGEPDEVNFLPDFSKTSSSSVSASEQSMSASQNESDANWARYENVKFGYSIDYWLDPQWTSVDTKENTVILFGEFQIPLIQDTIISQGHVVNLVHIYVTDDARILEYLAQNEPLTSGKLFASVPFQEFHFQGMAMPYGYVTARDGTYYVFESTDGPRNNRFEHMMQSLQFTE